MPMREMHQLKAIGAGRSIDFDDATKTIRMGFNVVEPDAVAKFKKGVLIGFSQGGAYVKKWDDPVFQGKTRYTADPSEISAVDSPCLPSALVESMKGRTFEMQKSNGSVELKKFEIPEGLEMQLVRMKRVVDTLLKHTNLLPENREGSKAATGGKENTMQKLTDIAGYQKAAKTLEDHLGRLAEIHKAHGEHMRKAHEAMEAKHDKLGEHIEKCMKAAKDASAGDEPEEAEKAHGPKPAPEPVAETDVSKAVKAATKEIEDKMAAMQKASTDAIAALTDKLSKIPAPVAAHTGAVAENRADLDPEMFKGVQVTH